MPARLALLAPLLHFFHFILQPSAFLLKPC
jgi:hypothetical protein